MIAFAMDNEHDGIGLRTGHATRTAHGPASQIDLGAKQQARMESESL